MLQVVRMKFEEAPTFDSSMVELYALTRDQEQYVNARYVLDDGVTFRVGAASIVRRGVEREHAYLQDYMLVTRSKDEEGQYTGAPTFAVCSGLGGSVDDRAAIIAGWSILRTFEHVGAEMEDQAAEAVMGKALMAAHVAIKAYARQQHHDMKATAAVVRPFRTPEGEWYMCVGHSGRNRVLEFTESAVIQYAKDHLAVEDWTPRRQYILAQAACPSDLTAPELTVFNRRQELRTSLGSRDKSLICTIGTYPLTDEGEIVLTTYGVSDQLTYTRIGEIVSSLMHRWEPNAAASDLVNAAFSVSTEEQIAGRSFRGTPADGSAIVFRVEESPRTP